MHLTGGLYNGHKIEIPRGVKPTLSKVRQGVFNSLNSYFNGNTNLKFLDLFSGSGLMALEAISRGYKTKSIEINPKNVKIIKQNFQKLKVTGDIINADCMKFLNATNEKFDVIYIDPPWCDENFKYDYNDILTSALDKLNENGIVVLECENIKKLPHQEINFDEKLIKERVYGRCLISFYVNCQNQSP